MSERRIEYVHVDQIKRAKRNPKRHAAEEIGASLDRFAFTEPLLVDERTGRLVAGHGRLDAILQRRESGGEPPHGVGPDWTVPVVRGWASKNDREAEAYLLASNRLVELGGWDEAMLAKMLEDVGTAGPLDGVGWSPDELERMLSLGSEVEQYTTKIQTPVYEPKSEEPPPLTALVDQTYALKLEREIDAAEGVPAGVKLFLRLAAQRHLVFDYEEIAEFYAHAPANVQDLMERSALVIVDFKKALASGFVKLTERLAETYPEEDASDSAA